MRRSNNRFSHPSRIVRWTNRLTGDMAQSRITAANGEISFPMSHGSTSAIMPEAERETMDEEYLPWDADNDLPEWNDSDNDALGGYAPCAF